MTYTPEYTDPAYNPATWSLGYQSRQVGVAGPSIFEALANPPATMTVAVGVTSEGLPASNVEPEPVYGLEDNSELQEVKKLKEEAPEILPPADTKRWQVPDTGDSP